MNSENDGVKSRNGKNGGQISSSKFGVLRKPKPHRWRVANGDERSGVAWWVFPILFLTGLVAGGVDAIAGGGGLLTVPALLSVGLPVPVALGTNKLQSSCGTALATWLFARAGLLRLPGLVWGLGSTLIGALIGAALIAHLDPAWLRRVLPILLIVMATYTWLKPDLGSERRTARLSPPWFGILAGLILGGYDGFFGPGTGSFWMLASVVLLGLDLRQATGWTKAMNLTSNLASLAVFLAHGQVAWGIGLTMATGQLVGARIGSGLVLHRGSRLIRPVFLTVVLALAAKLAFDAYQRSA